MRVRFLSALVALLFIVPSLYAVELCDYGAGNGGAHTGLGDLSPEQQRAYESLMMCRFDDFPDVDCEVAILRAYDLELGMAEIIEALVSNAHPVDMERACRIISRLKFRLQPLLN